jgi:hypothetical protein
MVAQPAFRHTNKLGVVHGLNLLTGNPGGE